MGGGQPTPGHSVYITVVLPDSCSPGYSHSEIRQRLQDVHLYICCSFKLYSEHLHPSEGDAALFAHCPALALPPPNTLQPAILLSSELSLFFRLPVLQPYWSIYSLPVRISSCFFCACRSGDKKTIHEKKNVINFLKRQQELKGN